MFASFLTKKSGKPSFILCGSRMVPQWIALKRGAAREYHGAFTLSGKNGEIRTKLIGRIVEWPGLPTEVYIYDPPQALRKHPHGRCFQLLTPNSLWFKLHWERPARTFDQARAYVEQLMAESLSV